MIKNRISDKASLILSFDDYDAANFEIAEMLQRLGLKATFFIETMPHRDGNLAIKQIADLSKMGFDIGGHTMSHPADLKALNAEEIIGEISTSKLQIEGVTGKPCTAFAYTRGRFNDQVVDAVKRCGFLEARTTHVLKLVNGIGENGLIDDEYYRYRMPTTIHVYDKRKEYQGLSWPEVAKEYLERVRTEGGAFHLWGHSWEILRDGQMQNLENFLKSIYQK